MSQSPQAKDLITTEHGDESMRALLRRIAHEACEKDKRSEPSYLVWSPSNISQGKNAWKKVVETFVPVAKPLH